MFSAFIGFSLRKTLTRLDVRQVRSVTGCRSLQTTPMSAALSTTWTQSFRNGRSVSAPAGMWRSTFAERRGSGRRGASPERGWPSTFIDLRERSKNGGFGNFVQEHARARGRTGGRKFALTKAQVRLAQAAMANRDTSVAELCKELKIRPVTLYRYVDPNGNLREYGKRVLEIA